MKTIENWWTVPGGDTFTAPEAAGICIVGTCEGHPKGQGHDGVIQTSRVKKVEGRVVKTVSGSIYYLGGIKPQFLAYLKECGYSFDPENPIKIVDEITFLEPKPN